VRYRRRGERPSPRLLCPIGTPVQQRQLLEKGAINGFYDLVVVEIFSPYH